MHEAFLAHVTAPWEALPPPVSVLGIDETRRGKPLWTQVPDTHPGVLARDRRPVVTGAGDPRNLLAGPHLDLVKHRGRSPRWPVSVACVADPGPGQD